MKKTHGRVGLMTSEELYRGCEANNEEAWTYAYNYVIRLLKRKLSNQQDLLDVAHSTVCYFMDSGLKKIRKPRAFKQWLRLKAMALFIDQYRFFKANPHEPFEIQAKNRQSSVENPKLHSVYTKVEETLFLEKVLSIMSEALRSTGKDCEDLLRRYFKARFLGETIDIIASELGTPASTIRVRIYRCHKKLISHPGYRALLEDYNL